MHVYVLTCVGSLLRGFGTDFLCCYFSWWYHRWIMSPTLKVVKCTKMPPPPPPPPTKKKKHTPTHTHTHAHVHTYIHTHTHARARAHTHAHTYTHTQTHVRAHTHTHEQRESRGTIRKITVNFYRLLTCQWTDAPQCLCECVRGARVCTFKSSCVTHTVVRPV